MKKTKGIWLIGVLCWAVTSVQAQDVGEWYYKATIGGNIATLSGDDGVNSKLGWSSNIEVGFQVSKLFAPSVGVMGQMLGYKDKVLDENMRLSYLNIPLLANFYITPWLAVKVGGLMGFLIRARMDGRNYKKYFNNIDFSIPIGISFEPVIGKDGALVIDFRYQLGLTDVNKTGIESCKNRAFILTVGYKMF